MHTAPPIKSLKRFPVSRRTLLVTASLLGMAAFAQLGTLVWKIANQPETTLSYPAAEPSVSTQSAPAAQADPTAARTAEILALEAQAATEAATAAAEAELAAAAAEKDLVAREAEERLVSAATAALPKPTPIPTPAARPTENVADLQINGLIQLARSLRDRGDTSTALTRLREAQVISPENPLIISEMAMIYEKMGLNAKALDQWKRIVEIGDKAGIYFAAAEAKLRAAELAIAAPALPQYEMEGSLIPEDFDYRPPVLSLDRPGTVEDTGNSQPLRRLKLHVPIKALPGLPVDAEQVVIQVYFYDKLQDGSLEETNAEVESRWVRRRNADGTETAIDWSSPQPEVLEVTYTQVAEEPEMDGRFQTGRRNYFGYVVHVYYKGQLNATHADQARLLTEFPAPLTLQPSDDLP